MSSRSARRYDNRLRTEQAAATRGRVLVAAREAFLARGYAGASMAGIAQAAGVSRETVYKVFGSKAQLLKAVYDVVVVGDDEPVPVQRREAWLSLVDDPDPWSMLRTFGQLSAQVVARVAPLQRVIDESAGDAELADITETTRHERLVGSRALVEALAHKTALRPDMDLARATDMVWTLCSPEVALLLTGNRQWSLDDYAAWLADSIARMLLPDPAPGRRSDEDGT